MRKIRLAYLATHPIQYQAPLLRRIAREPTIELKVFFGSDFSTRGFVDPEFTRVIEWDVPLLEGYDHEFLPAPVPARRASTWRPWNYGLVRRLEEGAFDALWVHGYARPYHCLAMAAAKRAGLKVMVRDEVNRISRPRNAARRLVKRGFFRWLAKVVDGFLAIGTLNEEYYRRHGIDGERIFRVPYAVDNAFFQRGAAAAAGRREELRASLGLEPGRPVILFAAKLTTRKRPADLLEAYLRFSPDGRSEPVPYLLYVGDGPERGVLERKVRTLGWHSVKFLGFKNQRDLPAYYDLCDVFVLPSIYEPWGLVVNEVMNAAKPVIVSDQVGCAYDLVRGKQSGLVFPAGDIAALHNALSPLVARPALRRRLGQRSLEVIDAWGLEEDVTGLRAALASLCGASLDTERCEFSLSAT